MRNKFLVWSESTKEWMIPRYTSYRTLNGPVRKKVGDQAILLEKGDYIKPEKRYLVMVVKSKDVNGRYYWWLKECRHG